MSDVDVQASSYLLEEGETGTTMVVTGPWTADAASEVQTGRIDGLILNYARGFSAADLDFLEPWPIRRLELLDRQLVDLEPLARLAGSLEELSVDVAEGATLDLGVLGHIRSLAADWSTIRGTVREATLQTLVTWRFEDEDLAPLAGQSELQRLTIKEAPRLASLFGLADLRALSTLEVGLARELVDIDYLSDVGSSLRKLKFETCLSVDELESVASLPGLHFLGINDCGRVQSLHPLRGLQELRAFHAWGSTHVSDGDLSPLMSLPRLSDVRMRGRAEYKPPLSVITASLAPQAGSS
jgi:internalin A